MNKAVEKYLKHYAETEVLGLITWPDNYHFNHVMVVPAYQEQPGFVERFCQQFDETHLLVLVINQPDTDTDIKPQQQLSQFIVGMGKVVWRSDNLLLINTSNAFVLIVDKFSQPIAAKRGVGLARKVGADVATALIAKKVVNTQFIGSSDADAYLPVDYFIALQQLTSSTSAAVFNFNHVGSPSQTYTNTQLYQQALKYYVAGLAWAGSNYAYPTIGSVLAFNYICYAKVRGFPQKSAGEDFYLLNKLAKLGDVAQCEPTVNLEARVSLRVPFGTGPAVNKINQLAEPERDYVYYHPQLFTELKAVLVWFKQLINARDWQQGQTVLSTSQWQVLLELGFAEFCQQQLCQQPKQFQQQLNVWFDAFKTLKFIHLTRELHFSDIPLLRAIKLCQFYSGEN